MRAVFSGFFALALWLAYLSHAHAVVPIGDGLWRGASGGASCDRAAPADAIKCALMVQNSLPAADLDNCSVTSQTTTFASGRCRYIPNNNYLTSSASKQPGSCPANSTSNGGGTCSCTAPYVENSTQTACITPPSAWEQACNSHASQSAGAGDWSGNSSQFGCAPVPGGGSSTQGCLVSGAGTGVRYQPTPGNWITSNSNTTYTGATCVPNVDAPSSVKDPCPNGQSGTVNGKSRCVPLDPTIPAEQTRETQTVNPDGSTTTTTESTSCSGGKCTTTSTSTTTGGSGGGGGSSTSSTTEGIADYCKKNPQTALCAKTNSGQSAETGDDKSDGECDSKSTVIGCAKFGTPPADQQIPKDTKTVGLGTSPVGGFGAVCPAPSSFTVYGQTFTISYTPLCDKASLIKPLILLVAAFISLGIVYSALKGA